MRVVCDDNGCFAYMEADDGTLWNADDVKDMREQLMATLVVCRGVKNFYCYGQNPQMDAVYRLALDLLREVVR